MRRLSIHFEVAFGRDQPEQEREVHQTVPASIERSDPDYVPERAELDARQPIGFRQETHRP